MRRFHILLALVLASCASTPRSAPRFVQPSTVPVQKAIAVTSQKQATVSQKIQAAQKVVTVVQNDCPQAKAEIDQLSSDLMSAYADNKDAEMSLQVAEGARAQLDAQLKSQTATANQLAANYDKASVQITGLQQSRHGWVKRFWVATAISVLAGVWIFRKPLLMAISGIGI